MRTIKNYGHIVNKQFKVNIKRNISTISGIILSIILFTIMGYIQTYTKDVNILDGKNRNGSYEAVLTNLSLEQVEQLRNNVLINEVGLYTDMYNSTIKIGDNEKNIQVYAVDNIIMKELFSPLIMLKSGKLPGKDTEILIDTVGMQFLHKEIGDTLNLGKREYTIVGTYDKINSNHPYTIEILTFFNKENNLKNINVAFNVINENDKEKTIRKIASDLGVENEENLKFNDLICYYYDLGDYKIDNQENITQVVLYGAVLVLTIFMTYGSINISLKERIEQFSILRCIGATPSKIRILLVRESLLLAFLAIVPGIILGQLVCFILSTAILQPIYSTTVHYKFYPNVILSVVLLSTISILLSTIIPVIKIGKISPIEGVRNANEINKTNKMRHSKTIRKIFGYNGLLAYKNIRGNNRSFLFTTITSIMILTIFIVFNGYSSTILNVFEKEQSELKDLELVIDTIDEKNYDDVFEELHKYKKEVEELGVTKEAFGQLQYFFSGIFEGVQLNKNIKQEEYNSIIGEKSIDIDGKKSTFSDMINLLVMDDNSLQEIISTMENRNLNLDDFKENGVLILNRLGTNNLLKLEKEPIFDLNINDKFTMKIDKKNYDLLDDSLDSQLKHLLRNYKTLDLKYLGSIDADEFKDFKQFEQMTTLIVSKDFYYNNKDVFIRKNQKIPLEARRISFNVDLKEDINRETHLRVIENYMNKIEGYYIDNQLSSWRIESQMIVISSMVYLVLGLTIIVGGLNLINNKNISMKLRGKEMGTLLAIGINKKRLKKIVILEAIIQWFISTVISLILSYTILTVVYKVLIYTNQIREGKFPVLITIFGCGILLIINILASYLPIRKLKYTNTTELIRNQE